MLHGLLNVTKIGGGGGGGSSSSSSSYNNNNNDNNKKFFNMNALIVLNSFQFVN